jgi:hypothetical protein
MTKRVPMRIEEFSFGSIPIDGTTDGHGVVIDRGQRQRCSDRPALASW